MPTGSVSSAARPRCCSRRCASRASASTSSAWRPQDFFGLDVGRQFDVALPLCGEVLTQNGEGRRRARAATGGSPRSGGSRPAARASRPSSTWRRCRPTIMAATMPADYTPEDEKIYREQQAHRLRRPSSGVSSIRTQFGEPLARAARRHRPGAADCVRQPGQSAAGPRQRARARDGGAPRHRRRAAPPRVRNCSSKACCWRWSARCWASSSRAR